MNNKVAYFVEKIKYALNNNDYAQAKMYFDKASLYVGDCQEIAEFKQAIDKGLEKAILTEPKTEEIEIKKRKTINEKMIIIPVVLIGIIGYLIYYFTSIYPINHLDKYLLGGTFYQGDVTGGYSSDGVYLEFKDQVEDHTYEIYYRQSGGSLIATLDCEVINGHEITVDGYTIQVEFDDDYITFSPSFVDVSDRSIWRTDREGGTNDKSGNFSDNNSYNSSNNITDNYSSKKDTNSSSSAEPDESSNPASSEQSDSAQNNTSTPSNNNNSTSKPSSTTQTTSKPTVNKDPCANGHSWQDATCTSPATCSVCKKTSGKPTGHDIFTTKCSICRQADYSKLAGTYTDAGGFYSGPYEEFDMSSFAISSSGILSFELNGQKYSLKLVEVESDYQWESYFDCYSLNGTKETDVTARANLDSSRTLMIFHVEWDYFNGREMYFSGEKEVK